MHAPRRAAVQRNPARPLSAKPSNAERERLVVDFHPLAGRNGGVHGRRAWKEQVHETALFAFAVALLVVVYPGQR